MIQEPASYWKPFKPKRLEENWLIEAANFSVWVGFWLAGAVCILGLWKIAFWS